MKQTLLALSLALAATSFGIGAILQSTPILEFLGNYYYKETHLVRI